MPRWVVILIGLFLGACSATEGMLLVRVDGGGGGGGGGAAGAGSSSPWRTTVRANMSVQYQITGTLDTQVAADLFVSDLFDTSARQVSTLHAAGRLAMAYVSVGTLESWRPDASDLPRDAVGMPLAAYPDEAWLDVRRDDVRALIQARFDLAVSKGFDGVFASTLGAYRASSGFDISRAEELEYAIFLADAAHARDMSIGLTGDFELSQQLAPHYDWAIAVGCIEGDFCADLMPLVAAGLAVFDLEIDGDRAAICSAAATYEIPVTFKHRAYDAFRSTCP